MSLGSREDAQPGQGAEGPLQPLLPPQSPGQVDSVGTLAPGWLEGNSGGCSEPFCICPLLPGLKSAQSTATPLLCPSRDPCHSEWESRSLPSLEKGEDWLALSGRVEQDGVLFHHLGSPQICVHAVSMSLSIWFGWSPL